MATLRDRARQKVPRKTLELFVAEQPDPAGYLKDLLEACSDPLCSFPQIAEVLEEDGYYITGETLRRWYRRQEKKPS